MSDPLVDISDRRMGFIGLAGGFLMVVWGFFSGDAVIGVLGIFGISAAGFILMRGTHAQRAIRRKARLEETWASRQEELIQQLQSGRTPSQIASDLETRHGLPSDLVFLLAAAQLIEWQESDDPAEREQAVRSLRLFEPDPPVPPGSYLDRLHQPGTVVYYDEDTLASSWPPDLAEKSTDGLLLLTPQYLYFLATPGLQVVDWLTGQLSKMVRKLPVLSQGVTIAQILLEARAVNQHPFPRWRIWALKRRLRNPASFAVPLRQMEALNIRTLFSPPFHLEVAYWNPDDERIRRWIYSPLHRQPPKEETKKKVEAWTRGWFDMIQLATLAEGNKPATSPPTERTRHSFSRTGSLVRDDADPGLLRAFHLRIALAFIIGLPCSGLGLYLLVTGDDPGWGLTLIILGVAILFFFLISGFRKDSQAQSSRDIGPISNIEDVLRNPGGLAQLAGEMQAQKGTTPVYTRMQGAKHIIHLSASGNPADRQRAAELAAVQQTTPRESPNVFLNTLSTDKSVYYLDVDITFRNPVFEPETDGILLLSTDYLYLFAHHTDETIPLVVRADRYDLSTQNISRLASLFEDANSIAVPLGKITALELVEPVTDQFALDVYGTNDSPDQTIRISWPNRPRHISSIHPPQTWMARIQTACAATGNLLTWADDAPRCSRAR